MPTSAVRKPSVPAPATLEPLLSLVKADMLAVNDVILGSISDDVPLIRRIAEHIIASGGKRLRPSLTIACAKLCGHEGTRQIGLAAAVELIHTATLLHDDVVDESTLRRGNETANAIWSNQASVLVGDFLLSRAFQLMVADGSIPILKVLSDASATISKGEVMQLAAANDSTTSEEHYLAIIGAKTAALFAAATEIGAIMADRDHYRQSLREYGEYLGIAFQLMDDALDYSADPQKLGKAVGDDFREGKLTLPVIIAYREGSSEEQAFWKRTLEDANQRDDDLAQAIQYIQKYDAVARAVQKAAEYAQRAEDILGALPANEARDALIATARFCANREF
ncbi:MAG: polyprenyl synthetase family protein [Rickettsiales bacterium]